VTHRLGKNCKFLLSVLSVFVSALAAVVVALLLYWNEWGCLLGERISLWEDLRELRELEVIYRGRVVFGKGLLGLRLLEEGLLIN
jgi:hypothetical protein